MYTAQLKKSWERNRSIEEVKLFYQHNNDLSVVVRILKEVSTMEAQW